MNRGIRQAWLGISIVSGLVAGYLLPAQLAPPPAPPAAIALAVEPAVPAPAPVSPAPPKLALIKPPPAGASTFPWLPDYLRVLERFPAYHARSWHDVNAAGEALGYFGPGDQSGAVAQARDLLALAYLATDPGYDPRPSGIPAAALRDQALRSLRHLLRTHTTGDRDRVGGGRWGGDAAAARVIGPFVAASRLLEHELTPHDLAAVERVVAREADYWLEQSPAAGSPRESRAGENAAAADCLAWAAALLSDRPSAPRWEYQARWFAMNALSAPQDRASAAVVDSRPVRDWVVAESLLPDYLLESGGAVNPDAELRAVASLSDGYYASIRQARSVPEALTHHFEDAWGALLRLWLGGGRFARPAGSAEPSGTAGDVALFPVTALLEWVGSEPSVARLIERERFQTLEAEQMAHADGSFFGGRASESAEVEAAAALALSALIHRQHRALVTPAEREPLQAQLAGAWTSPAAALAAARSRSCFASWAWHSVGALDAPVGLLASAEGEALAAWGPDQLVGSFALEGFTAARSLHHRERTIEGGFTATGQIEEGRKEGRPGLHHFVAFAALPAGRVAVAFDLTVAAQAVTVTRSEGLRLRLPDDLLAGGRHSLKSEEAPMTLALPDPGQPAADRSIASPWLNLDDHMGAATLYSQEPFTLRSVAPRAAERPTGGESAVGAAAGEIDNPFSTQPVSYQPGQIVRDTVLLLVAGDAATTARLQHAGAVLPTGSELVRAAVVPALDGSRYLVAANFGLKETSVTLRPPGAEPLPNLRLPPLDTLVRELKH